MSKYTGILGALLFTVLVIIAVIFILGQIDEQSPICSSGSYKEMTFIDESFTATNGQFISPRQKRAVIGD